MKRLKAPKAVTSCAWRGREYKVDAEGFVHLPDRAARELRAHGFRPAPSHVSHGRDQPHQRSPDAIDGMNRAALRARLEALGVPVPRRAGPARLRHLLREARAMRLAGAGEG